MKAYRNIIFQLLTIILLFSACSPKPFDLQQLIRDVFDPQPGENVLILVDMPHESLTDHEAWRERRQMAEDWKLGFEALANKMEFNVYPIMTYAATGAHNGPLPDIGEMDGTEIAFDDIFAESHIVVAMTEYSATAPLIEYARKFPHLRVASMPGVSPAMQDTALAVDHEKMAERCNLIDEKLSDAIAARVLFVTGHQMYFDLHHRHPEVDDGMLHQDTSGLGVINLPSGETFIAPYEGEIEDQPSETHGIIPLQCGVTRALIHVSENRVTHVTGDEHCAKQFREFFETDEALRNIAELGFGCNDRAIVTGNVLEDEKVYGIHLAFGRSDHIGGVIGPEDFSDPANVMHVDYVYALEGEMWPIDVNLIYEDGSKFEIIRDNKYAIFK
jgi:hypothetical protein